MAIDPSTPISGMAAGAASAAKKPSMASRVSKGLASGSKDAANAATSAEHDLLSQAHAETMRPAQMFHKGGKIKNDGEQVINAEKGETVLPNEDKEKALELAVDHLKGMGDGMSRKSKAKKKEPEKKKEEPKHEKHKTDMKKHGRVKKMHITRADDNTFMMEHEHEPSADGMAMPNTQHTAQDMDQLHDHLEDHMGEPNPGEAEAEAGPSPMPAGAPGA